MRTIKPETVRRVYNRHNGGHFFDKETITFWHVSQCSPAYRVKNGSYVFIEKYHRPDEETFYKVWMLFPLGVSVLSGCTKYTVKALTNTPHFPTEEEAHQFAREKIAEMEQVTE